MKKANAWWLPALSCSLLEIITDVSYSIFKRIYSVCRTYSVFFVALCEIALDSYRGTIYTRVRQD